VLSDSVKPDIYLIEPGGISGSEVNVVSGEKRQPIFNSLMFMGGVVIDDEMYIEVFGHGRFNMFEKAEVFLMTMAFSALGKDLASRDIKSCKKSCCAMPNVIMRHALDISQTHGQDGLGAVESLDLAFFIHT
jgi:hypothetical protein